MIDVKAMITENSDPEFRRFHSSLVPGLHDVHGVRMPVLRGICREICKDDWRSFLESGCTCYEEVVLHALVIASASMDPDERMERTRGFVPMIDNWAVCDAFCGTWDEKGSDMDGLWDYCSELLESDDEFMMRVSAVMMLSHFIDDAHIDGILERCSSYRHDGYYFRLGSAWLLSSCFVRYPEKTETVLFSGDMDPDIRSKAVGKICDSYRVDRAVKERLRSRNRGIRGI